MLFVDILNLLAFLLLRLVRSIADRNQHGRLFVVCNAKELLALLGIEVADPDVRVDMETIFNRLVPENRPEYEHTLEGADDMPAHAKSTLSGVSITIPITEGRLNLGTWQGIYFCEYRNYGGSRELVVTIIGE